MQTSEQYAGTSCLKVSSKSSPASVAGAIAGMVKDGVPVEIACVPSFADIIIDGEYRTAIHFAIKAQYLRGTMDDDEGYSNTLF